MSSHEERCPHCRAKQAGENAAVEVEPITVPEPPEAPREFRIHYPDGHARDYTLHPDGRLTMQIDAELYVTSLTFAFMTETSWDGAHIEWDPQPLPEYELAAPEAEVEPVQDVIPLLAA